MSRPHGEGSDDRAGRAEAAHWFVRLESGDLPPEEWPAWEGWLKNLSNRIEFEATERLWRALRVAAPPPVPTPTELAADAYEPECPISDWLASNSRPAAPQTEGWRTPGVPKRTALLAAAASVALVAGGVAFYLKHAAIRAQTGAASRSYATRLGEFQEVSLPDGSTISLGSGTELLTAYTANQRTIFLSRGKAWFAVTHDGRPFTVMAGSGTITAVGTRFYVERDTEPSEDRVNITVTQGTVEVTPRALEARYAKRLVQGQEISYTAAGLTGDETALSASRTARTWRERRLEYRHVNLGQIVSEINRYSPKPIVLEGPDVADLQFTGTVFQGQIHEWVRALADIFPVDILETEDQILIRTHAGSSPGTSPAAR